MKLPVNMMYFLVTVIILSWGLSAVAEESVTSQANTPPQSTDLTFEISPEVIKAKAREGQFLSIPMLKMPLDYQTFSRMYDEYLKKKKAGIHIAVIVDAENENWPDKDTTMQINKVHKFAKQVMIGNKKTQKPGYAELYGARINKIIPVVYDPKNEKSVYKKIAPGQYQTSKVPVSVNDIILLVNDYKPAEKNDGAFINTIDELKMHLEDFLKDGLYKISNAQYLEQLQVRIRQLDSELNDLYEHRKELKELKELLPHVNEP